MTSTRIDADNILSLKNFVIDAVILGNGVRSLTLRGTLQIRNSCKVSIDAFYTSVDRKDEGKLHLHTARDDRLDSRLSGFCSQKRGISKFVHRLPAFDFRNPSMSRSHQIIKSPLVICVRCRRQQQSQPGAGAMR